MVVVMLKGKVCATDMYCWILIQCTHLPHAITDCIEQSLKNYFKNDCMTPWLWSMVYRGQNLSEYRPCSNKDQYLDINRKFVWSLDTISHTCASKCQRAIYVLSFYSFQNIIILNFDPQSHAQQHGSVHLNQEFGIQMTICRDGI